MLNVKIAGLALVGALAFAAPSAHAASPVAFTTLATSEAFVLNAQYGYGYRYRTRDRYRYRGRYGRRCTVRRTCVYRFGVRRCRVVRRCRY